MERNAVPRKRARGSYAKLICLRCRERRIKCQLAEYADVVPSSEPQPPHKACKRCQQQGLPCVVRRTTLGRPNANKAPPATLPSPPLTGRNESRSPSPDAEALVLLALDDGESAAKEKPMVRSAVASLLTGAHMYGMVSRSLDLTSSLLARDRRYGSSIESLKTKQPKALTDILNVEIVRALDQCLVWHRLYMPWLPTLTQLWTDVNGMSSVSPHHLSASVLLALLASIAMDVPSDHIARYRHLQHDLNCVVHTSGQALLFAMPRDDYFLTFLELTHSHRPLLPNDGHHAAAHTVSGNLYATLCQSMQQRLGLHLAAKHLVAHSRMGQPRSKEEIERLVMSTLRWCSTIIWQISLDLQEVEVGPAEQYEPARELDRFLHIAGQAIHGYELHRCYFVYHMLRCQRDDLVTICDMTANWKQVDSLYGHVEAHLSLKEARQTDFELGLAALFFNQGRTEDGYALAQLVSIEQGRGHSHVVGLAMFYAIMSGSHSMTAVNPTTGCPVARLSQSYTERIDQEATRQYSDSTSGIGQFLSCYGDMHIDVLERRLQSFIDTASTLSLRGIPFTGPHRHTGTDVLLACREVVENNAVRIKFDKCLHHNVDNQLRLFEEAAKRLEHMEAGGGTPDAIARGSVLTACAKSIRCLWKLVSEWKKKYAPEQIAETMQLPATDMQDASGWSDAWASMYTSPVNFPVVDMFNAEGGFEAPDPAQVGGLFTFDMSNAQYW